MASQADFETAAKRRAVDRRSEWFATGLQLSQRLLQSAAPAIDLLRVRTLLECLDQPQQIGTRHERIFSGRNNSTFDFVVTRNLVDSIRQILQKLRRHHIHRPVFDVDRQNNDTVFINFVINRFHFFIQNL